MEFKDIKDRIRYIRQGMLRFTRKKMLDKYGLSTETLAAWETGKTGITSKAITRFIEICENENLVVNRDWLLNGNGLPPIFAQEVTNFFKQDAQVVHGNNINETILLFKEIEYFKSLHTNSIVLLVANDDMDPFYTKNDYVGGIPKAETELESCIGKDCLVMLNNDEHVYFRRLFKTITGWNLSILNPAYSSSHSEPIMFNVDIKLVAPVIWHRRII